MGDVNSREFAAHVFSGIIGATATLALAALVWPSPVQATVPAIPTQLDLGGVQWKVDLVDHPNFQLGFIGYTQCDTHRIEIIANSDDKRHILMHEILHAYVCRPIPGGFDVENFYYNSKTEESHEGFDRLSDIINDAMQRNPGLAVYLAGAR